MVSLGHSTTVWNEGPACGNSGLRLGSRVDVFFPSERRIQIWGREMAVGVPIPYSLVFFLSAKPPQRVTTTKENCRLHRDNDQIMCNMEQWAKEQK